MTYRGARFEEMDIDALLARRPEVALVDELAHTNVPGSRNAKRWQDVEELLEAGITVISTVTVSSVCSMPEIRPTSVAIPVAVTTNSPAPRVTLVCMYTMSARSPSGVLALSTGSADLVTGRLSPVSEDYRPRAARAASDRGAGG
jgi:hypothetical protein